MADKKKTGSTATFTTMDELEAVLTAEFKALWWLGTKRNIEKGTYGVTIGIKNSEDENVYYNGSSKKDYNEALQKAIAASKK